MTMASYDKESLEKMISIIKGVFQRHTVTLKETLEGYLSDFSDKMLEKGLIVSGVNYDHQKMMKQYMVGLQPDSVDSIENHCRTFITILKNLGTAGGPILKEALQLEQDIKKDVENEFVDLNFLGQSNSSRLPSLDQPDPYTTVGLEVHRDSSDSKPQFTSISTVKSYPQNPILITGSTQHHNSTCVHTQSADSGITSKTDITMTTNYDEYSRAHDIPAIATPSFRTDTTDDPTDGLLVRKSNMHYSNSDLELLQICFAEIVNLKEQLEWVNKKKMNKRIDQNREHKEQLKGKEYKIEELKNDIRELKQKVERMDEELKQERNDLKNEMRQRITDTKDIAQHRKQLEERERIMEERERKIQQRERMAEEREQQMEGGNPH